ncbi:MULTISPECIES: glycosyltransferase family A protein [Enterobacterales]|jgi:glycosyltransferase involved in cell wall biosynthesis|uniref:Glycosyl transferase family 2 n=1 Tax=Candidatus Pantoea symbiotica TaxID=1884370 RepID=A0A1I4E4V5_9GAMM|nr:MULTISPECIES: glycosyltransferase family A protein [Enterobacterales]MRS18858.1 glycosyltransferase [Enterobacteriaceae bacterium RIT692]MRT26080.1 glycosyltransferase [Enterobacteriaceae bacterium RIT697]KAJ9434080.1 glycosyltransferase family A protein [Pantoea sp. YR343]MBB3305589.1 glycosyltransferase involved in cell wall biosynthesis [Enterobacter sp. Sphag1F]NYI14405.1 glycosyltransferase involved in cell wall biosynthesis [Enterobacter sp. Sphag71]
MNEKPLFSLIIPVYNSQKTIKRTLLSVLKQTFSSYEVIVVNDGSSDTTANILQEFSAYSQVTVIHQINAGVSAARNSGMQQASGEYVLFLDADDWVDDNFLMIFKQNLDAWPAESVDLMVGNLNDNRVGKVSQAGFFSNEDIPYVLGELEMSDNIGYLHNKCYRRQIIEELNLRFLEGISMSEDLLFNLKFFSCISNFLVTPGAAYHYEDVEGSLSKRKVQYSELKVRKQFLTALYDSIISKYQSSNLDYFLKGISKRVLALDMQIVTAMYHSSFSPADIAQEINEIKRGKYSKGIFILLNKNEKLKYMIMNLNTLTAYYFLYALYRMRAF